MNWEIPVNWEIIDGTWQQMKGRLQEHWGRLLGDELMVIAGRRTQQAGRLLQRYGVARQDAERQLLRCQRLQANLVRVPAATRRPPAASYRITY